MEVNSERREQAQCLFVPSSKYQGSLFRRNRCRRHDRSDSCELLYTGRRTGD